MSEWLGRHAWGTVGKQRRCDLHFGLRACKGRIKESLMKSVTYLFSLKSRRAQVTGTGTKESIEMMPFIGVPRFKLGSCLWLLTGSRSCSDGPTAKHAVTSGSERSRSPSNQKNNNEHRLAEGIVTVFGRRTSIRGRHSTVEPQQMGLLKPFNMKRARALWEK